MKWIFSLFTSLCFCASAFSADLTLKNGRVLKDATISDKGVDFVRVHHSEGIAKILFRDLSEELQKKYNMTAEEVQLRLDVQRKKEDDQKIREREAAKKLRASLSEAEKSPRYMKGSDILKLMVSVADVSPVEAEYAALVWNSSEARRVGLNDQAQSFMEQIALYEPRVKDARLRREKDGDKYEKEREKFQSEIVESNRKIAWLQSKVTSLQGDLVQAKNEQNSRTVFVEPPVIYNPPRPPIIIAPPVYPPRPPIILPPRPPRPNIPIPLPGRGDSRKNASA